MQPHSRKCVWVPYASVYKIKPFLNDLQRVKLYLNNLQHVRLDQLPRVRVADRGVDVVQGLLHDSRGNVHFLPILSTGIYILLLPF